MDDFHNMGTDGLAVRGARSVPTGSFYENGGGADGAKAVRIIATLASQYHRPLRRHSGKKTALLAIRLWLVTSQAWRQPKPC
jgi:hypothetical protein